MEIKRAQSDKITCAVEAILHRNEYRSTLSNKVKTFSMGPDTTNQERKGKD